MRGLRARSLRVAVLLLAALCVARGAWAGENAVFGAEPYPSYDGAGRRSIDLPMSSARGSLRDAIRVYNRTGRPIDLALYPAAASVGEDGVVGVEFRGARRSGLAASITLQRDRVRVGPKGDAVVRFTVDPRGTAPDALAAIVVEGAPAPGAADLDLVQRIAIIVRRSGEGNGPMPANSASLTGLRVWAFAAMMAAAIAVLRHRRQRRRAEQVPDGAAV